MTANTTGIEFFRDIVSFSKYAKYLATENRRETTQETINRNMAMHLAKFPHLKNELDTAYGLIHDGYFVPSMRSMQFAGKPIEKINERVYNCAFCNITEIAVFSELTFLLLCGTGVGYSVKHRHIDQLPNKKEVWGKYEYVIQDSIEGWADAVYALIEAHLVTGVLPTFIYDKIRQAGSRLSSGAIAPGPEKLKICLDRVHALLSQVIPGQNLRPLEVHDIMCHLSECVVAGGIRRSAMICLFDWNDVEMLTSKMGDWYTDNPQRAMCNNSAHLLKSDPQVRLKFAFVSNYAKEAMRSGSGDPGIYWTNNLDWGTNPCCEVSLDNNFCNLVDINGRQITNQKDFNKLAHWGAFIGTLQASYTEFNYLRPIWKQKTEEQALIGVGITSVVEGSVLDLDMPTAAMSAVRSNAEFASNIGINQAWRVTTIKPSGTSTAYMGNLASGCHDIPVTTDSKYYLRTMRVGKMEPIYQYLNIVAPGLMVDVPGQEDYLAAVRIPIDGSYIENAKTASTPYEFLERVSRLYNEWVVPGHNQGVNTNNVSATCTVPEADTDGVFEWLWENRENYMGMSVLPPIDMARYALPPIEPCSKETFDQFSSHLVKFSAEGVYEPEDMTKQSENLACAGGNCEVVAL